MTSINNPAVHASSDSAAQIEVSSERATNLRRWNIAMGTLHGISGVVMLILANDFTLPVGARYLLGPPGTGFEDATTTELFAFPLAIGTAGFLLLSALFHGIIATVGFSRYLDELRHGRNRFRWVEYSASSTLMIVLIAMLNITEFAALIAIAGANIAMILFGWIMEMVNRPGEPVWWTPFAFGSVIGLVPWLVLAFYLVQPGTPEGSPSAPGFVYGIVFTIFVFFNTFAVNQWAQYAQKGRWKDYLVGEKTYQVLSLVAKSALAWQIFANTLIPA
ncbi:heliorhodopsin HeR [Euzebya tangerina]|uniref:heliorhodopsin HeR n=1 Tax=Euzebya tangerina TaxID=591198 RepID=UPI000E30BF21|nr:heliorhodopsin HeR [Euzebya tangerina]